MRLILKYVCLFVTVLILSTCKKYDDGGFIMQTRLHLFGGHKTGDSKTWKLKLYEVNGIDSTYLIQGANSIPGFYEKFVTFKLVDKKAPYSGRVNSFLYTYDCQVDHTYKKLGIMHAYGTTHGDSIQCKTIDNQLYCSRDIFLPDIDKLGLGWHIRKLTKTECVLTIQLDNSYKIILTYDQ